jgi:DNA-directed RNA polymerase I subunit RPA49
MADRSEKKKKRKREKDGSSKPSKRVAIEGDKQIKISLLESDEWAPVIGMLKQGFQLPIFCYARTDTY